MHFDVELDPRLVTAISPTYDVGNYTGSIVAAVQLLSDVIRNKSGLESDGQSLAGAAFGGPNPIIKINPLRTDSEKDEQKGVEALLRGIYTGIRNPRSHELRKDSADAANAIITFVNWLLRLIEGSKSPFDPEDIIERVLDDHFVPSDKYAALLASEVPPRIRLDVLIRLVDRLSYTKATNARVFANAVLGLMNESERIQYWENISAKLLTGDSEGELMTLVRLCATNWLNCSEMARLRSENRLLKAIREGKVDPGNRVAKGWPGVRAVEIETNFSLREGLHKTLAEKLYTYDEDQRRYFHRHFAEVFYRLEPIPSERTKRVITKRLQDQDSDTYHAFIFVQDLGPEDPWFVAFESQLASFVYKDDEIPF